MIPGNGIMVRQIHRDNSITRQKVKRGTARRIFPYARQYKWTLALLLFATVTDSLATIAAPLLLGVIIDYAILPHRINVLIELSFAIVLIALLDALATYLQSWSSARIGQGIVFDLRTQVFDNVQRQPLAFFTRAQTGSLVSRLNTDVIGAQQAVTSLLSRTLSVIVTLALTLSALFALSWQVTIIGLMAIPFFIVPGKIIARWLQRLAREQMQLDAELGSMMNERFNVAGAILAKLYGRPKEESELFERKAGRIRDIGVVAAVYDSIFSILLGLLAALLTALVYGLGGSLAISGSLKIGTLVALAALIVRLYGPINQLSVIQASFMTALVSFDRVFEVLDLKPLIRDRPGALALPAGKTGSGTAPQIDFDHVFFRYPDKSEVSLPSLESISLPAPERAGGEDAPVLRDVTFCAPRGKLTALVGPSGAGKTTITHLIPRLYDPTSGTVRIDGYDIRDLTLRSLHATIGVVPQDAHMFHDTIRANLLYARPGATEKELITACDAARIWDLISSLPDKLDTVAGDRGYRFSGGEKQRLALARLLLKAPPVVVLDEATAHLDSESEIAIQEALKAALADRTSLVIAHRLSTIRDADQILVIDSGQIREHGTHEELLAAGELYAELYTTQFSRRPARGDEEGRGR